MHLGARETGSQILGPSSRDASLVTRYLKPLISISFNPLKELYRNKTYLQWFCKHNWRLNVAFDTNDCWNSQKNGVSDWHVEYGDTRSPSLHTRLLNHVIMFYTYIYIYIYIYIVVVHQYHRSLMFNHQPSAMARYRWYLFIHKSQSSMVSHQPSPNEKVIYIYIYFTELGIPLRKKCMTTSHLHNGTHCSGKATGFWMLYFRHGHIHGLFFIHMMYRIVYSWYYHYV